MPTDPISNRTYEDSIEGFKLWAETELPHGLPLVYAGVGFITICSLLSVAVGLFALLTPLSPPLWGWAAIPFFGILWAHGGWIHGQKASDELDAEPNPWDRMF